MAHEYTDTETGRTELAFDFLAFGKISDAIEKKYPGWFHTCYPNPDKDERIDKENCPACKRNQLRKERGLT
jgi:hypothetical protein